MERDDFAWWNRRIRKLSEIFGMYRIDHILGFYRIYAFPWMPDRNQEFLNLTPEEAAARCQGRRPGFRPRGIGLQKIGVLTSFRVIICSVNCCRLHLD